MLKYKIEEKAPSTRQIIRDFEAALNEFKSNSGIPDEKYYNIMVALTEGINNAAGHGNKFDDEKCVYLGLEFDEHKLICRISDQGDGYNPESVADPRSPENLLKDNGRGVFLMKSLSNKFSVVREKNCNIVEMVFEY